MFIVVANKLCTSCLCFQGEICVASSRVFVQEEIYDEFEKKLVEKAKSWVVGDPFDPKSLQGPQVGTIYMIA